MQPILGFVEHDGLWTVDHIVGDLLAAMGRQAGISIKTGIVTLAGDPDPAPRGNWRSQTNAPNDSARTWVTGRGVVQLRRYYCSDTMIADAFIAMLSSSPMRPAAASQCS
jgi:hypothetical protein